MTIIPKIKHLFETKTNENKQNLSYMQNKQPAYIHCQNYKEHPYIYRVHPKIQTNK